MKGLTMFRATKKAPPPGPPPAEMRGRAAQISDPAAFGWEVLWEALKTEPPADEPSTITQELGLVQETSILRSQPSGMPATEFSGARHGRHVALRMGVVPGIRAKGYNEVHVAVSVSPFRIREHEGRPTADASAMPEVGEALAGLAPAPQVWRKLEVEGGPDGILARRPVTAHPQGYLYDLWLIERLADRLASSADVAHHRVSAT
jgi:hypothetical protein